MKTAYNARWTIEEVKKLRCDYVNGRTLSDIARAYKTNPTTVSYMIFGATYKSVPLPPEIEAKNWERRAAHDRQLERENLADSAEEWRAQRNDARNDRRRLIELLECQTETLEQIQSLMLALFAAGAVTESGKALVTDCMKAINDTLSDSRVSLVAARESVHEDDLRDQRDSFCRF